MEMPPAYWKILHSTKNFANAIAVYDNLIFCCAVWWKLHLKRKFSFKLLLKQNNI